MNIQSIRIFLAIVEHKSISEAARALYFSQSAVSQSLNQLEKELGVQLVIRERGARQIRLTPAGEAFVPLAQRRKDADMQIQQFILMQKQKSIRIAANATAHLYLVPEITQNMMQCCTALDLQLTSKNNMSIPAYVESNLCDVAFFNGDTPVSKELTAIPFFQSEICILCSAETSLPDGPTSPAALNPHFEITHRAFSSTEKHLEWHRRYFPADIPSRVQTSTFMSLDNYLTDPRCWAAIPLIQALYFVSRNPSKLSVRRIDPVPYYHTWNILISKASLRTEIIEDFLQCCRKYLDSRPYLINCLPQ